MSLNLPKIEKRILRFWKENEIFEKSIRRRKKKRSFVFYEGPPTANARPGIHHVLARVFKDIICRYKTMRGFRVERKGGWDTHGLPVELEIEKKLELKSKKEIEKYGIDKFNEKCRRSVWEYKKEWEKLTERIAFWIDLKHPYITYTPEYIESVWRILKESWKRKLLSKGYKVVPFCPRCGTCLSSHEVALGYKKIKEPAIYVKFQLKNPQDLKLKKDNTYFLIWTTTPWTLPGNVAVGINPEFDYCILDTKKEYLILAKERVSEIEKEGEIIKEFKGKELVGLKYFPPFFHQKCKEENCRCYEIVPADFVSLEEGTGLVHLAPAFGEEDMEAIKTQNSKFKTQNLPEFPVLLTVDEEGRFKSEVKKWEGIFVKEADHLIIEDLKNRDLLFKEEIYEHDYPFCWRCKTPLLYYAKDSWFIGMSKLKQKLIENNQKINWVPSYLKEGRFGEWLKEVKDWALSRERYWGTPLPIWICKNCQNIEVIGGLKDLLKQRFSQNTYYLFRHGHSMRQLKNSASCWPEKIPFPLTEKGKREVLRSAKKLKKIDLIFSSDLLRTKETAEIISKETGAKIIFDKRLREVDVGVFNGKDPKLVWDFIFKQKDPYTTKVPKGESLLNIQKRVWSLLNDITRKYQRKRIVLVSHELPLTILEKTLEGFSIEKIIEWRKRNRSKLLKTGQFRKIEFKKLPFNKKMKLDFHRPFIDEVRFYCPKCHHSMERVKEVIDCWFDSGSMPFAQAHWPFEKKKFLFPADYICEGIDQTRGWFYTLLAVSTLLGFSSPYKNVVSLGHVLDEKGEKMSKSRGNVVDPWEMIEKYGVEAIRWYFFTINQPGDSKLFSEKDIRESLRKFIFTLWNCYLFLDTYKRNFRFKTNKINLKTKGKLERWIISRLQKLILEVTQALEKYEIVKSARRVEEFVINDLSLWYIRRSRAHFQKPKTKKELKEAVETLSFVLFNLSKLIAPFLPFISEEIYQRIRFPKSPFSRFSVHLENWPKVEKKWIDEKLERKMEKAREIASLALAERAKAKIKIRQPLRSLKIRSKELKGERELLELIREEVNVKEMVFDPKIKGEIELDIKITPELKEEGIARELIRQVQYLRKLAKLSPKDKVRVYWFTQGEIKNIFQKWEEKILREAKIEEFIFTFPFGKVLFQKEIEIEGERLTLGIKKIRK